MQAPTKTDEQVKVMAARLTRGQRSTVVNLDATEYDILGCAEPTAIRLCKGGNRRPPLVEARAYTGTDYPMVKQVFRLTALGMRVKAAILAA